MLTLIKKYIFLQVCLAFAGVSCEAEADPYTIGQVLAGVPAAKTALDGQTRILTHTSYPGGLVQPNGVVYSRAAAAYPTAAYAAYPTAAYAAYPTAAYSGYSAYSGYPAYAGVHALGKREADAEAEAEAEPWTLGQVAAGLPLLNAAAEGRAPGHIAYTSYNGVRVAGAPALSYAAAPAVSYAAAPAVSYAAAPAVSYAAAPAVSAVSYAAAVPTTVGYSAYSSYPYTAGYTRYAAASYPYHHLGKREADAEADAYTIGQVAAGLPYANAVATGHAHNPGYLAYTSYPSTALRSSVYGYPAVRSVYSGYPTYANYGAYGAIYG